jgi:anti-sigma regulatory factor (Ser/Thr protein kinase)
MSSTGSDSKASLVIGNAIAEMEKVVHLVNRFGADHDIPQDVINDLNLCLDELLSNTISYGYEDQDIHSIVVNLSLTDGRLIAEIQDDAKPFDPREGTPAALGGTLQSRKVGGLGIHFVKTLMDEVGYRRMGKRNVVRIEKKLRGEREDGNR